jgi:hypothetical protein
LAPWWLLNYRLKRSTTLKFSRTKTNGKEKMAARQERDNNRAKCVRDGSNANIRVLVFHCSRHLLKSYSVNFGLLHTASHRGPWTLVQSCALFCAQLLSSLPTRLDPFEKSEQIVHNFNISFNRAAVQSWFPSPPPRSPRFRP